MSIQSDDLIMVSVGALADVPTEREQPPLPDGIHLRWAFRRERGFPWYGYFLFRRPHEGRGARCVDGDLTAVGPGPTTDTTWETAAGTITSDAALVFTDDFGPAGTAELDLTDREGVTLQRPHGDPAFRVDVTIGCRGALKSTQRCVRFDLEPIRLPSPLVLDGVRFDAGELRPRKPRFTIGRADPRSDPGLVVTEPLTVTLPEPTGVVELRYTILEGTIELQALDAYGETTEIMGRRPTAGRSQVLTFRTGGEHDRFRLVVEGRLLLHRVCFELTAPATTEITVSALDGPVEVERATLAGDPGALVSATLVSDRITAVRISGGPAAIVSLCARPVLLGLARDWEPVRNCPQPLTLPIRHPDYPAWTGAPDVDDAWDATEPRVTYGPPADWRPGFDDLHDHLAELVAGGPAGPAMADPGRAATRVAGVATNPGPGAGDPYAERLHPLDLVLLGALHAPLAQIAGLYWADTTAHPQGVYDYLVVADHTGIGKRDPMTMLKSFAADPVQAEGWVCFARTVGPSPPVEPPAGPVAYALPGGSYRAVDGTAAQCAGNVGLIWSQDRDDSGRLRPGSAVFHHVWRDAQGDQAAPQPSLGGSALLTSAGPLLSARRSGIQIDDVRRPHDWPQFALRYLDFSLQSGWYAYEVTAIDLFGRFSARSRAPWHQWAGRPRAAAVVLHRAAGRARGAPDRRAGPGHARPAAAHRGARHVAGPG